MTINASGLMYSSSQSSSMLNSNMLALTLILLSPLLTALFGFSIFRRQNSKKAWTGGPISRPKAHWLAFTIINWFIIPFAYFFHTEFPKELHWFFVFHLASWWIRGPLELFMIYRWFNWSPVYGISHDVFHVLGCSSLLLAFANWETWSATHFSLAAYLFCFLILLTTTFEISFAALFLQTRSQQEETENIYFASDDPKWIFINRLTLTCVVISYTTLLVNSGLMLTLF